MLLMMPSIRIAQWFCATEKGVGRALDKKYSAPARIRKGQGAEALNRALCVALQKLGYTGVGNGRG